MEEKDPKLIQFPVAPPARDGAMPFDRSGQAENLTRQQARAAQRAQAKQEEALLKKQEELRNMLEKPVTKKEFQRAMFNVFGSLEKVVAEFRKLSVRNEAVQAVLYSKGVLTKEEFEDMATKHLKWNTKIDEVTGMYENTPISEIVKVVSDWNNVEDMKISWQHIDLAPRLLANEDMTLEEKLQIAADFEMPEAFIAELRNRENGNFAEEAAAELASSLEETTPQE